MGTAAWNQGWSWEAAHPGGGATHKMGAEDGFWMDGWCWRSGPSLICSTEPRPDGAGGAQPTEQLDQPAQPTLLGRRPLDQSRPRGTKPAHPTRLDRAGLIHQPTTTRPDRPAQRVPTETRRDGRHKTNEREDKTGRENDTRQNGRYIRRVGEEGGGISRRCRCWVLCPRHWCLAHWGN